MVKDAEEIYHNLLNAGFKEKEIENHIQQKTIEFQGMISKDAILYLIAKECGIDISHLEDEKNRDDNVGDSLDYNEFLIPISKVIQGLQNIVIKGTISNIFEIREFIRKDGSPGRVGTFQICDDSDCIKVVLWGDHVKFMENNLFERGIIVQVVGGYSKKGLNEQMEIHLSNQGKIVLPEVKQSKEIQTASHLKTMKQSKISIKDIYEKDGFIRSVTGIVHIEEFKELTLKSGDKTFLLKISLTDSTGSIRVNIWGIKAVELLKMLTDGEDVKISNVMIKLNSYSNEKEISLTKSSRLKQE